MATDRSGNHSGADSSAMDRARGVTWQLRAPYFHGENRYTFTEGDKKLVVDVDECGRFVLSEPPAIMLSVFARQE